jgi:nucleoside-diphosphate-sugar epimerase
MGIVAVTGANGFIGRHVCAELAAGGWEVRAVVRRLAATRDLPAGVQPIDILRMDEPDAWTNALDGAAAVVHLIGRAHVMRDLATDSLAAYLAVNVGITQTLLKACRSQAVPRLVYLSSIKAVGEGAEGPYTEDSLCRPEDAYGTTKRCAEELLLEQRNTAGVETVILRPPLIYGPGVKGNFLRLLRAVEVGLPLPVARIRNARSMLYIGNLVRSIRFLLQSPHWPSNIYHVVDDDPPLSTPDLVRRIAALMRRTPRLLPCPVGLLKAGLTLVARREDARRLTCSLVVDGTKLKEELGWNPPISALDGLRETVDWYLSLREKRGSIGLG